MSTDEKTATDELVETILAAVAGADNIRERCENFVSRLYVRFMEQLRDDLKMELKMEVLAEVFQVLEDSIEPVTAQTSDYMFADLGASIIDDGVMRNHADIGMRQGDDGMFGIGPVHIRDDIFDDITKEQTSSRFEPHDEPATPTQLEVEDKLKDDPIFKMIMGGIDRRQRGLTPYSDDDLISMRRGRFNPDDKDLREQIDMDVIGSMDYQEADVNPEFDKVMKDKFGVSDDLPDGEY